MKKTINLEKYKRDGFIVLRNFYSKNKTNHIKKGLVKHLSKNWKKYNKREINFSNKKKVINSVHNLKWPRIKVLQRDPKVKKTIKYLIGNYKNFGSEIFAKPANVGLASPPHQDNSYWNIVNGNGITMWIALGVSNKKNGALYYYRGSHKSGLQKHLPSFVPGSSKTVKVGKKIKKFKKITPELNKGDVLLHDNLIIHGSTKNRSKIERVGLTLRFIQKKGRIDIKKKRKYERELFKQIKLRDNNNARI